MGNELKPEIKKIQEEFWEQSGYSRFDTQNNAIMDDAVKFAFLRALDLHAPRTPNITDKVNILAVAESHKKHCKDEHCGVSLVLLMQFAQKNGVKFTEEEQKTFL